MTVDDLRKQLISELDQLIERQKDAKNLEITISFSVRAKEAKEDFKIIGNIDNHEQN